MAAEATLSGLRPSFQQIMLRVQNPLKSLDFYRNCMGMTLIDKYSFPQWEFDLYFLATIPEGTEYTLEPGTDDAHGYLWTIQGTVLELTHNYGTETNYNFRYHAGNQEKDGFGHVAFNCLDVYDACAKLAEKKVTFKKKPDEGRMKGLAFAYDPDGYWVEIVQRSPESEFTNYFNLSQCMLRVKNPTRSVPFYQALGMTLVRELHFDSFSLYFMATLPEGVEGPDPKSPEARAFVKTLFNPVLELTHNHGTEDDASFQHFTGNEENRKGFGHIGFIVDDVEQCCSELEKLGHGFKKRPDGGNMKGLAFALDPDGYWVEIVKRNGYGDNHQVWKTE